MNDDIARRLQITTESIKTGSASLVVADYAAENSKLRCQLDAAKLVIAGLDRRAIAHGKASEILLAKASNVAGERAANAVLTAEIERMRADRDNLRVVLESVRVWFSPDTMIGKGMLKLVDDALGEA